MFEKQPFLGGVCNRFSEDGFTFDAGPSWWLMNDIYEQFFGLVGEKMSDHIRLTRLSPHARVIFDASGDIFDYGASEEGDRAFFEKKSPGSWDRYQSYLKEGENLYDLSQKYFLHENYDSAFHFVRPSYLPLLPSLRLFSSIKGEVAKVARGSDEIGALLSFPSAFLGAPPEHLPALFSFLGSSLVKGVFYPAGGMYSIVEALVALGKKYGVEYLTGVETKTIVRGGDRATGVLLSDGREISCDAVVSAVDASYTRTHLLGESGVSPLKPSYSVLLLYLGVQGAIPELAHHTIFFSPDRGRQFREIEIGELPYEPSLYITATSKTDPSTAPVGAENLFVLVPIGARAYEKEELANYADFIESYIEEKLKIPNFKKRIIYRKSVGGSFFSEQYGTYGNSALGPAHTLMQSGPWRHNNVHPSIKNLYFAGSSTNPGIGIPPTLLSAERAWKRIVNDFPQK